jgi:hypothetical protein
VGGGDWPARDVLPRVLEEGMTRRLTTSTGDDRARRLRSCSVRRTCRENAATKRGRVPWPVGCEAQRHAKEKAAQRRSSTTPQAPAAVSIWPLALCSSGMLVMSSSGPRGACGHRSRVEAIPGWASSRPRGELDHSGLDAPRSFVQLDAIDDKEVGGEPPHRVSYFVRREIDGVPIAHRTLDLNTSRTSFPLVADLSGADREARETGDQCEPKWRWTGPP